LTELRNLRNTGTFVVQREFKTVTFNARFEAFTAVIFEVEVFWVRLHVVLGYDNINVSEVYTA